MFKIIVAVLLTGQAYVYAPEVPTQDGSQPAHVQKTFDTQEACDEFVQNDETFQVDIAKLQLHVSGPIAVSCQSEDKLVEPKEEGSPH